MRILSFLVLSLFLFSACGFRHPVQTAIRQYKHQTPPEYYSQAKPASFTPNTDSATPLQGSPATESGDTIPETKSEKSHAVLIGVLVGISVVAGTVVPILLLK